MGDDLTTRLRAVLSRLEVDPYYGAHEDDVKALMGDAVEAADRLHVLEAESHAWSGLAAAAVAWRERPTSHTPDGDEWRLIQAVDAWLAAAREQGDTPADRFENGWTDLHGAAPSAPVLPEPDGLDLLREALSYIKQVGLAVGAGHPLLLQRERLIERLAVVLAVSSPGVGAEPESASDVPVPTPADDEFDGVRYYVARCAGCEIDIPFDHAQARNDWGAEHAIGTGHTVTLGRGTCRDDFTPIARDAGSGTP